MATLGVIRPLNLRASAVTAELALGMLGLPEGSGLTSVANLRLLDETNAPVRAQFSVAERWGGGLEDGTKELKVVHVAAAVSLAAGAGAVKRFTVTDGGAFVSASALAWSYTLNGVASTRSLGNEITVATGAATFVIPRDSGKLLKKATVGGVDLVTSGMAGGLEDVMPGWITTSQYGEAIGATTLRIGAADLFTGTGGETARIYPAAAYIFGPSLNIGAASFIPRGILGMAVGQRCVLGFGTPRAETVRIQAITSGGISFTTDLSGAATVGCANAHLSGELCVVTASATGTPLYQDRAVTAVSYVAQGNGDTGQTFRNRITVAALTAAIEKYTVIERGTGTGASFVPAGDVTYSSANHTPSLCDVLDGALPTPLHLSAGVAPDIGINPAFSVQNGVRCVIRKQGWLTDSAGRRGCSYVLHYVFTPGNAQVEIEAEWRNPRPFGYENNNLSDPQGHCYIRRRRLGQTVRGLAYVPGDPWSPPPD